MTMGQRTDAASVAAKEVELGLNQPVFYRYLKYLDDLSPLSLYSANPKSFYGFKPENSPHAKVWDMGNKKLVFKAPYLGRSFQTGNPVSKSIGDKLMNTVWLTVFSIAFASIIGILLGIVAALKKSTWIDNLILVVSTLGISLPSYFFGILLAMLFAYYLKHWTGLNLTGSFIETDDLGDPILVWKNLILPVLALGSRPVAIITQLTRSTMLDVLSQDYIRTAKAKGLSKNVVLFKHALRNAMNPVITSISGWVAGLLAGAFFVEMIFSYQGLGNLTVNALMSFDFPVVMGVVLYVAVVIVVVNIIADILYGIFDPRISLSATV